MWGSTYKSNLKTYYSSKQGHSYYITYECQENCDAMYNELGIIKFVNINKYLIGRFMFRVYHGQLPEFFSPFF